MSGAWLRVRPTRCENCGWEGRLRRSAPCPACGATDNDDQTLTLPLLDSGPALYVDDDGQGEPAWFDDPDAVRVIPRRPDRTAQATHTNEDRRASNRDRVAELSADGASIAKIAAVTGFSPRYVSDLRREARERPRP